MAPASRNSFLPGSPVSPDSPRAAAPQQTPPRFPSAQKSADPETIARSSWPIPIQNAPAPAPALPLASPVARAYASFRFGSELRDSQSSPRRGSPSSLPLSARIVTRVSQKKEPLRRAALVAFQLKLRLDLRDSRRPVRQLRACIAAAEVAGQPANQRASLVHVFRRDPDVIAVGHGGPVVSPARPSSVGGHRIVTGEAIIGSRAFRRDVNVAQAIPGVNARIAGARIVIVAQHGERHHSPSVFRRRNRGIRQIIARNSRIALLLDLAGMRVDHKIRDARPRRGVSVYNQSR